MDEVLERIAVALEKLANRGDREVQLDLPLVDEKLERLKDATSLKGAPAEVAPLKRALIETSKSEPEPEVSEMSRDAIKAALDEMDVKYSSRTSTPNLYKAFLKAEADFKAEAEENIIVQAQAVDKVDKVDKVDQIEVKEEADLSFDALKGILSDYSRQSTEHAQHIKDLIKAFGPSAKLSELSLDQKKELLFNFQAMVKGNEADSFLG